MITDPKQFETKIQLIRNLIWDEKTQITSISRFPYKSLDEEKIMKQYEVYFENFPVNLQPAQNEIGISAFSAEFFDAYYLVRHEKSQFYSDRWNEILTKRAAFDPKLHRDVVENFIEDLIHNLVYFYEKILANTKRQYYFACIDNELKILLCLLDRYKSIIADSKTQVEVFGSLQLTKKISDLLVEVLIEFIEYRISLLSESSFPKSPEKTFFEFPISSILWQGTQQELCELFVQLEKQGWINEVKSGDRKSIADSITKIFDLSNTKKSDNSDFRKSFYQIFKGELKGYNRIYPFLEKESYTKKFDKIQENKNNTHNSYPK